MIPFASSRSYGRAVRFHDGGSAAPVSAKPRRHHSCAPPSPVRAVALADLEDRHVRPARAAGSSPRTSSRLPSRLRRSTECSLDSGFVDGDRPAAAGAAPLARRRHRRRASRTARPCARRDERGRDDLGQAGAGERRRGRRPGRSSGIGAVGRHRGVRQHRRDALVAADAGDLLGDVGLDREVAPPGRARWRDDVAASPASTSSGFGPAATTHARARPAPARSRSRREPAARAARRPSSVVAEQAVDASRPERDACATGGSSGAVSTTPRATVAAGPLGDQPGGPVRAEARQPELLALLEAQAGLGAQRVAEGRPADADRVEDRRLDDDVASSSSADLRRRRRPSRRRWPRGPSGSAMSSVSASGRGRRGRASRAAPRRGPPDDDPAVRWTAAASNVWIGLPSSSIT